jgi:hypothetical protein
MPNPRNQKAKIASLLDNPLFPTSSVYGNFRTFHFVARLFHVLDVTVR